MIQSPVSIIPAPVDDPAVPDAEETIRTYLDHAAAARYAAAGDLLRERCARERAPQRPAPAPTRRARPRRPRQRTRGVVLLDGDLRGADDARSGRHGCVRSDVRRRRSHRHRLLPRRRVRGRSRGARAPAATPTCRRCGGVPDHSGGRLGRGRPRRRRRTRDRRQPQAGCRAVRARHLQHGARHPAVPRRVAERRAAVAGGRPRRWRGPVVHRRPRRGRRVPVGARVLRPTRSCRLGHQRVRRRRR